jgi:hypothetical protein
MAMSFHIAKIECCSIWAIDMMVTGKLEYNVFNDIATGEGPICPMWQTCPSTTKWHGSTGPFPWWANIIHGHEIPNISVEGKSTLMPQVEGARTCTWLTNNT